MKNIALRIKTFIAALLVMLCISASAQSKHKGVHLLDGSVFYGQILDTTVSGNVRVQIYGNNIVAIPKKDILRIEGAPKKMKQTDDYSLKSKGLIAQIGLGLMLGEGQRASSVLGSLQFMYGYQFNERFRLSGGAGLESFGELVIPVFLDGKVFLKGGNFSPYLYGQGGFGFRESQGSSSNNKGGLMASGGIGLARQIGRGSAFYFAAGYRFQQLTTDYYQYSPFESTVETKEQYNRVHVSISLAF